VPARTGRHRHRPLRDLLEPVPQPQGNRCWRRFDNWPPGISWGYTRPVGRVFVQIRRAPLPLSQGLPVGSGAQTAESERPVSICVSGRGDDCIKAGWLVVPGHRRGGAVDGIGHRPARGGHHSCQLATGVCRGCCKCRASRTGCAGADQRCAAGGSNSPGHVIDGPAPRDVRAGVHD